MSSDALPISNLRFAAALKDLSLASLHLKTLEIRNSLAHLAYSNAQLRPFAEGIQPTLDTASSAPANTDAAAGGDGDNSRNYEPDPDCVEAIRENEAVMQRMCERIELVRAEVEGRGVSWREFEAPAEEMEDTDPGIVAVATTTAGEQAERGSLPLTNGVNGHVVDGQDAAAAAAAARGATEEEMSSSSNNNNTTSARASGNPWTDGTFQTGVIRNGEVHMDAVPGNRRGGGGENVNDRQAAGAGSVTGATTTSATTTGGRLTDEDLRRLLEQRLAEDEDGDAAEEDGGLHL